MATRSPRATPAQIMGWPDDPGAPPGNTPIADPVPKLNTPPLAVTIAGRALQPGVYRRGTDEFRYWATAEAARRAADFWTSVVPSSTRWHTGATLQINRDAGVDLNAFYDRQGLSFFHDTVAGITVYSGESPDVVCHEEGHALLDAIRPQLWDAASIEVAAFHESFGDMSAILSALQLQPVRLGVLSETGGHLYRSSRLSRLAEQLGWAIRQSHPDAVDPDCLRNAVNSFFYHEPSMLPPSAPANSLSTEPHSFSRVFTGGFFEALAAMLALTSNTPSEQQLLQISRDMGRLLVYGASAAPIVPDFFSSVAGHMIEGDARLFSGRYREALKSAFVRHGILSLPAATALTSQQLTTAAARGMAGNGATGARGMAPSPPDATLPRTTIAAADYGFGTEPLVVYAPSETKQLPAASAALSVASAQPPSHVEAATAFTVSLLRRGHVDIGEYGVAESRVVHSFGTKTHRLVKEAEGLVLTRRLFDCGFKVPIH